MVKTTITLSIDADIKRKALKITQNKLKSSLSGYVEERLMELILSNSTKSIQEVKK